MSCCNLHVLRLVARLADPAHQSMVKRVAGSWQALKGAGVDFIVAPYEADAQMAYLALNGKVHAVRIAHGAMTAADLCWQGSLMQASSPIPTLHPDSLAPQVITEDSDMLPYGCPRVLFKMDKAGAGQQVCLADLPRNRDPGFAGFTHDMFLEVRRALRALRTVVR